MQNVLITYPHLHLHTFKNDFARLWEQKLQALKGDKLMGVEE